MRTAGLENKNEWRQIMKGKTLAVLMALGLVPSAIIAQQQDNERSDAPPRREEPRPNRSSSDAPRPPRDEGRSSRDDSDVRRSARDSRPPRPDQDRSQERAPRPMREPAAGRRDDSGPNPETRRPRAMERGPAGPRPRDFEAYRGGGPSFDGGPRVGPPGDFGRGPVLLRRRIIEETWEYRHPGPSEQMLRRIHRHRALRGLGPHRPPFIEGGPDQGRGPQDRFDARPAPRREVRDRRPDQLQDAPRPRRMDGDRSVSRPERPERGGVVGRENRDSENRSERDVRPQPEARRREADRPGASDGDVQREAGPRRSERGADGERSPDRGGREDRGERPPPPRPPEGGSDTR